MPKTGDKRLYLGYTAAEIADSGRDLLALGVLKSGSPTLENMRGILPEVNRNRYLFLSGTASWYGLTVTPGGSVYPQDTAQIPRPAPLFSPSDESIDELNAEIKQSIADGFIPVVTTSYVTGEDRTDITCFVEFGDPDSNPQLWVCADHISAGEKHCYVISHSRPVLKREISFEEFDEARLTTIDEWRNLSRGFDGFVLPSQGTPSQGMSYKEIQTGLKAMSVNVFSTFSGDHGHYGHKYYGREIHDNFPPNYLSGIELCYTLGMTDRAWSICEHLLRFGIDIKGRFCYRQGGNDLYAAAGTEYGRLFWLINRLRELSAKENPLNKHLDTLARMGDYLIEQIRPDPKNSERSYLMMCAEADTRSRIEVYAGNNLWAAVGLQSLGKIFAAYSNPKSAYFSDKGNRLYKDIRTAMDAEVYQSAFGALVPFQLGYSALPLTLSLCRNFTDAPKPAEEYFKHLDFDAEAETEQDYSANTYANYRYYAEMLSSGLLRKEEADAITAMREELGGELLGMSRLYERLDDWPADNYARYYLESDRLDKYLMLYYAHILYHGNLDTGVYYEQVTLDGGVHAPDCIPSMTLAPLMTAWMFCYQPVNEDDVYLLRGIPSDWWNGDKIFSAKDLCCGAGRFSVTVTPTSEKTTIEIETAPDAARNVYIDLRLNPLPKAEDIAVTNGKLSKTPVAGRFSLLLTEERAVITIKA
ncbi:hypothetical protein FACS1894219_07050 [Clostridia bacterium]|nr:hypothetical protein FACS1894219_07050 [Clostridia bacterium]